MTTDPFTEELLRLAREQTALLSSQFLAPVKPGRPVLVRLAGQWCSMMIVPPSFEGWGVFRPLTQTVALYCRDATDTECADYLSTLTGVTFADRVCRMAILPADEADVSLGVPIHDGKQRPRRFANFQSPPRLS